MPCVQKKHYSNEIPDWLSAAGVLSYIRKWECIFGWEQYDLEWRRDRASEIQNGVSRHCEDYVQYNEWCSCNNHY